MARKQEKATQRAVNRENKKGIMREERHVLWLLVAIILLLLWLLIAQHKGWWPYSRPKLGSAFYTNIEGGTAVPGSASTISEGASSGSGSGGSTSGGDTTNPPTSGSGSDSSLLHFAAGVNVGDTMSDVSGQATGLTTGCSVIASANLQTAGKQEVCTYTQGDKIVTVTYLNDRVISASKSGF